MRSIVQLITGSVLACAFVAPGVVAAQEIPTSKLSATTLERPGADGQFKPRQHELAPDRSRTATITKFERFADPTKWLVAEREAVRFRLTTAAERERNWWRPGTYLVEVPRLRETLQRGAQNLNFVVPFVSTPDDATAPVLPVSMTLALQSTTTGVKFLERRAVHGQLQARTIDPTFFSWWTRDSARSGRVLVVRSSDLGGMQMKGYLDGYSMNAGLVPTGASISDLPAAGGAPDTADLMLVEQQYVLESGAMDQCSSGVCEWLCADLGGIQEDGTVCGENDNLDPPVHACNDGVDNDSDGTTDFSDHECKHHDDYGCDDYASGHQHKKEYGKYFAYMGEGMWCKRAHDDNDGAWWLPAFTLASETSSYFQAVNPNPGLWSQTHMEIAGAGCWLFESFGDAHACTIDGDCPAGYGAYPYDGAGNWSLNYISKAWDDLRHGVSVDGLDFPVSLVQVLYYANGDDMALEYEENDEVVEACGVALGNDADKASVTDATSRVTNTDISPCDWLDAKIISAHEFGHTLGLGHQENTGSFMDDDGGDWEAWLNNANMNQLESCLSDWECPRPSGF